MPKRKRNNNNKNYNKKTKKQKYKVVTVERAASNDKPLLEEKNDNTNIEENHNKKPKESISSKISKMFDRGMSCYKLDNVLYRNNVDLSSDGDVYLGSMLIHKILHSRRSDKIQQIDILIKYGLELNWRNPAGRIDLFSNRNFWPDDVADIIDILISEKGLRCNVTDHSGMTVLYGTNNLAVVDVLLKHGISVNSVNYQGETALSYAAKYNLPNDIIIRLMEAGSNINIPDIHGYTARDYMYCSLRIENQLMRCIEMGDTEAVYNILHNSDVNTDQMHMDAYVTLAAIYNHQNILSIILQTEDISSYTTNMFLNDSLILKLLISYGVNPNIKPPVSGGLSLLNIAVMHGKVDIVEVLLQGGASINKYFGGGQTALHLAFIQENHEEMVNLLLKYGADLTVRSADGKTPLHYAAIHSNNFEVIKLLLNRSNKYSLNAIDNDKKTLMHYFFSKHFNADNINEVIDIAEARGFNFIQHGYKLIDLINEKNGLPNSISEYIHQRLKQPAKSEDKPLESIKESPEEDIKSTDVDESPDANDQPVDNSGIENPPISDVFNYDKLGLSLNGYNFEIEDTNLRFINYSNEHGSIEGWYNDVVIRELLTNTTPSVFLSEQFLSFSNTAYNAAYTEDRGYYYKEFFNYAICNTISGAMNNDSGQAVCPVNLGNMHWAFIYIFYNSETKQLKSVYYDPKNIHLEDRSIVVSDEEVINFKHSLQNILLYYKNQLDIDAELIEPDHLQQIDGMSCGPLLIENICQIITYDFDNITKEQCESIFSSILQSEISYYRSAQWHFCPNSRLNHLPDNFLEEGLGYAEEEGVFLNHDYSSTHTNYVVSEEQYDYSNYEYRMDSEYQPW